MDIKLEKKPWYIRYRYYLMGGLLFAAFLGYVVILSLGPRKLRIDAENVQIAEVKEDNFMEYVDVEGLIQPILTIKVNTREAGSEERTAGNPNPTTTAASQRNGSNGASTAATRQKQVCD